MDRAVIHTDDAPAAVGPYSQAIRIGPFLYTAGQIGLDPATGKLVEDEIEIQTKRVLENLRAVLQAAGGDLSNVVKTTVFLLDMAEFKVMNGVYAGFFWRQPTRTFGRTGKCLAAGRACRNRGCCIYSRIRQRTDK